MRPTAQGELRTKELVTGVVQRLFLDNCTSPRSEDSNLELGSDGRMGSGEVGQRDRLPDRVPVATRGHVGDGLPVIGIDGLVPVCVSSVRVDRQAAETMRNALDALAYEQRPSR